MGQISVGDVVFVHFPFSDLTATKKRPALVLSVLAKNDLILCQITSKDYADSSAIRIQDDAFETGSLLRVSYIRPGKLFTANVSIVDKVVGRLKVAARQSVVLQVIKLIS